MISGEEKTRPIIDPELAEILYVLKEETLKRRQITDNGLYRAEITKYLETEVERIVEERKYRWIELQIATNSSWSEDEISEMALECLTQLQNQINDAALFKDKYLSSLMLLEYAKKTIRGAEQSVIELKKSSKYPKLSHHVQQINELNYICIKIAQAMCGTLSTGRSSKKEIIRCRADIVRAVKIRNDVLIRLIAEEKKIDAIEARRSLALFQRQQEIQLEEAKRLVKAEVERLQRQEDDRSRKICQEPDGSLPLHVRNP